MRKFLTCAIFAVLAVSIPSAVGLFLSLSVPPSYDEEIYEVVTLPSGATLTSVIRLLKDNGIIREPIVFGLLARWRGLETAIKSGEYQLSTRMFPNQVLNKLIRGEQIKYSITIPEGLDIAQTAALFERIGLADAAKFYQTATDPSFIAALDMQGDTLEGYLFPDTYKFIRGIGEKNIIRRMVRRFNAVYDEQLRKREKELNLTRNEVITMASMIEKETAAAYERPLISAVFHNRLKTNMRLQCDPTVIYGLETFSGRLTKKDLRTYTPYNTYLITGLPPTPIANPGLASIQAVLYPDPVDYLYFVSKNNGTHYFSTTLAEHNEAVASYRRIFNAEGSPGPESSDQP
ncbi:MAG: endolytic transglycosylase MltG [Deltaproteobacteria bacterium]|nr:endolytic transglycosylase MltG [Deltaproteobacteria bacterium]